MDLSDIMLYGDGNIMEKKKEATNLLPDPVLITQLGQAEFDRIQKEAKKNGFPQETLDKMNTP